MLSFAQGTRTLEAFSRELWTKTLSCGSMNAEKSVKALFVEGVIHPNPETLQRWWAANKQVSLENLA